MPAAHIRHVAAACSTWEIRERRGTLTWASGEQDASRPHPIHSARSDFADRNHTQTRGRTLKSRCRRLPGTRPASRSPKRGASNTIPRSILMSTTTGLMRAKILRYPATTPTCICTSTSRVAPARAMVTRVRKDPPIRQSQRVNSHSHCTGRPRRLIPIPTRSRSLSLTCKTCETQMQMQKPGWACIRIHLPQPAAAPPVPTSQRGTLPHPQSRQRRSASRSRPPVGRCPSTYCAATPSARRTGRGVAGRWSRQLRTGRISRRTREHSTRGRLRVHASRSPSRPAPSATPR